VKFGLTQLRAAVLLDQTSFHQFFLDLFQRLPLGFGQFEFDQSEFVVGIVATQFHLKLLHPIPSFHNRRRRLREPERASQLFIPLAPRKARSEMMMMPTLICS
jgi:hypothetical protein